MTKQQIEKIVAWWIPKLGLQSWQIDVLWEFHPSDTHMSFDDEHATTWRSRDYEEARIYFNPALIESWDASQANRTAVHELLHLLAHDIEFVIDLLEDMLHRDLDTVITRAHRHAVERSIDRLSYRLVELVGEYEMLPES